jgi:nitrogen fixation NifU-like protein
MSESDLRDLYQEVILEHGRRPLHAGRPERYDAAAKGDNPMCGDRIELFVSFGADGGIADARFVARGCAISVASADLMAEAVTGRSVATTRTLFDRFRTMVVSGECPDCDTAMQSLKALAGVHEYPSRVKCATLPWHTLMAALDGGGQATSE